MAWSNNIQTNEWVWQELFPFFYFFASDRTSKNKVKGYANQLSRLLKVVSILQVGMTAQNNS